MPKTLDLAPIFEKAQISPCFPNIFALQKPIKMKTLQFIIQNHPASIYCTIKLKGNLTSTDAIYVKDQLCKNIQKFGPQISIDLSEVKEIDLTGFNFLLIAKKSFLRAGKTIIFNLPQTGPVQEIIRMTKFEQFLNAA